MTVQERTYTADELLMLPRGSERYALVRGELIVLSLTGEAHGLLAAEMTQLLMNFTDSEELGRVYGAETGFRLFKNPDTVYGVDTAYVTKERLRPVQEGYFDGAPDLAVEIVSPGNTKIEMHQKVSDFFAAGARLVWVLYPKSRAIYVYTAADVVNILTDDAELTGGDVLAGFSVKVANIFGVLDK